MKKLLFISFLSIFIYNKVYAAQVVCIDVKGNYIVRNKCGKKESRARLADLSNKLKLNSLKITSKGSPGEAGLQGPQGLEGLSGPSGNIGLIGLKGSLNLESCRKVEGYGTNFLDNQNPLIAAVANCNSATEYMLNWGYRKDFGNFVNPSAIYVVNSVDKISQNGTPVGVSIEGVRIAPSQVNDVIGLYALAVCCPKN